MSDSLNLEHPGHYVRARVIPAGMSVTKAAQTIGVGRPALSNLLNGNAALSPQMAARLHKAFGADPDDLMRRQAVYDSSRRPGGRDVSTTTRRYVPAFLMAKANDIEKWADTIDARSRLPVLLRNLVHSTCGGLKHVDFPGNDDAQRRGWDGKVETTEGNPWVPEGISAWEFGTDRDIKRKANDDYAKRTKATEETERQNTAFVFVTPRRWPGKAVWLSERRAEGRWRVVQALDSNDIEQWLEQSIPAQAWFGSLRGIDMRGVKSLDKCWVKWCADCEPGFTEHIFDEAMAAFGGTIRSHLRNAEDGLLRVVADSREEGLAFLHTVLSRQDEDLRGFRDRVVVFTKPGQLPALAVGSPGFIPVVADMEVERELAQSGCKLKGFVIDWRTAVQHEATLTLEPLSNEAFRKALESMGLDRDEIERLDRESGRSLTVLRRRLAKSAAIRSPDWSSEQEFAQALAPMMLAGAWNTNNEADRYLMGELAGCDDHGQLETQFNRLLNLEASPVWAAGGLYGVVSKIDALYAVHRWINPDQIERFMTVAAIVLSERDPALDLPEDKRPMAAIFGKSREISSPLRKGLAESLVLLAIHGRRLFGERMGPDDPERLAEKMVRELLEPMTADNLLSQATNLPLYAEAAPGEFLSILKRDLEKNQPAVATLMNPVTDTIFGRHDRVHLLSALEILAWRPEWLPRVVELLGQLAEVEPNDNIVNKPSESLLSVLGWWMPQTAASLEQRIDAFDLLTRRQPEIAWQVAISQFSGHPRVAFNNHKPMWRGYALGLRESVKRHVAHTFIEHCVETCLNWPAHSPQQLDDLMSRAESMDSKQRERLGEAIASWSGSAADMDRAWLRERIRVTMKRMMRRAVRHKKDMPAFDDCVHLANNAIDTLEPEDLVWNHAWLFRTGWVEEGWEDAEDDTGLAARDRYVRSLRLNAMRDVIGNCGQAGAVRLAFTGQGADVAGQYAAEAIQDYSQRLELAQLVLADNDVLTSERHQALLQGFLRGVGSRCAIQLIDALWPEWGEDVGVKLLCLCGFDRPVWTRVQALSESVSSKYWTQVNPSWRQHSEEDTNYAVVRLLEIRRALAAVDYAHLDWGRVDSALIRRILHEMPQSDQADFSRVRLDHYSIEQAFKVLNERNALGRDEMAQLEFVYFEMFWPETGKTPNLEEEIEANPELFCEAISLAYKRDDSDADPEPSDNDRVMAEKAHKLLGILSRIPGHDEKGVLSADKLTEWVRRAREFCNASGHRSTGDYQIGQLLSKAPDGEDGVWPCAPVREVLDSVLNDNIEEGFQIGRRNLRGVHARAAGGTQERAWAARYEEWAKACDYSFPRVAAALRGLAKGYLRDARWEDQEAAVQRRLGY